MACKHDGGTRPCKRRAGNCVIGKRKYDQARYLRVGKKTRSRARKYAKRFMRHAGISPRDYRDRGAAGEHLVISDLLSRHLSTGGPYNQNGPHDVFVKVAGEWKTVQVKLGAVNTKTGVIKLQLGGSNRGIISDLIAAVDLEGKRIRWISNTSEPVPKELL